jgi:hypothetical protein
MGYIIEQDVRVVEVLLCSLGFGAVVTRCNFTHIILQPVVTVGQAEPVFWSRLWQLPAIYLDSEDSEGELWLMSNLKASGLRALA